jgi:hypothetical protein
MAGNVGMGELVVNRQVRAKNGARSPRRASLCHSYL